MFLGGARRVELERKAEKVGAALVDRRERDGISGANAAGGGVAGEEGEGGANDIMV